MEMYTTDMPPAVDDRPVASAFLVWAVDSTLREALEAIETQARKGGASAIVGLRIAVGDSTYYDPGNTYAGGVGARLGGGSYWAAYGTALKRKGDLSPREWYERAIKLRQKFPNLGLGLSPPAVVGEVPTRSDS
ncbi:hypothetical protein AB0C13_25420 [Streptomyces sp. NPDC049099]|uniref:hypothetical protein n=1 Tax=Streptomyces sp. NPDC049099 TaxID=3155768 RepID=UPI003447FA81